MKPKNGQYLQYSDYMLCREVTQPSKRSPVGCFLSDSDMDEQYSSKDPSINVTKIYLSTYNQSIY